MHLPEASAGCGRGLQYPAEYSREYQHGRYMYLEPCGNEYRICSNSFLRGNIHRGAGMNPRPIHIGPSANPELGTPGEPRGCWLSGALRRAKNLQRASYWVNASLHRYDARAGCRCRGQHPWVHVAGHQRDRYMYLASRGVDMENSHKLDFKGEHSSQSGNEPPADAHRSEFEPGTRHTR